MAFKPLHDRVLVKRVESDEKTKGGLIIPDTAKEKPAEAEIVAVGEDVDAAQHAVAGVGVELDFLGSHFGCS